PGTLLSEGLAGFRVTSVVPLDNGTNDPNHQTVLVAALGPDDRSGVFRSTDSGSSFTRVGTGLATDLVRDPSKNAPGRVYAAYAGLDGGGHFMGLFVSKPSATPGNHDPGTLAGPAGATPPAPPTASLNVATTNRVNFVNTGAATGTITRTTGDWRAEGFAVGQTVTVCTRTAKGGVIYRDCR